MSLLDQLPSDIQDLIYHCKFELETQNLQAFVDDFRMKVISYKKVKEITINNSIWFNETFTTIYKYSVKLQLTYTPTNKSIILSFTHCVKEHNELIPKVKDVLYKLSYDAFVMTDGDWTYVDDSKRDYSYKRFIEEWNSDMKESEFSYWKHKVKQLRLVLEDRYDKFIECHFMQKH
jgi:hypothetical protein